MKSEVAMHQCPKCKSRDLHRSRAKLWEAWRRAVTGRRPFRCRTCGWRGWDEDRGSSSDTTLALAHRARAAASPPPNLAGTVFAPTTAPRHDLDLHTIDDAFALADEEPQ